MSYKIKCGRLNPKAEPTFGKAKPKKQKKFTIPFNRLRDKPSQKNSNTIAEEDKDYLEWLQLQSIGCFVCGKFNGIEWHHVKLNSTDKKNNKRLIPLCGEEHHRNGELSPHGNPSKWRDTYTIEVQNNFADNVYVSYLRSEGENVDNNRFENF